MALDSKYLMVVERTLERHLEQPVYSMPVVNDRSASLPEGETYLRIRNFDTDVTINTLGSDGEITYQDMDDKDVLLELKGYSYWAVKFDDYDTAGIAVNLGSEATMQAAAQLMVTRENLLLAAHKAPARTTLGTGRNIAGFTVDADADLVTSGKGQNSFVHSMPASGGTGRKWDSAEGRADIIDQFLNLNDTATRLHWPMNRYALVAPELKTQINKYMVDRGTSGFLSQPLEALQNVSFARIGNFNLIESLGLTGDGSTAGTEQFECHFGIVGQTLSYVQAGVRTEAFRSPTHARDEMRHLIRWGFCVPQNQMRMLLSFTFT